MRNLVRLIIALASLGVLYNLRTVPELLRVSQTPHLIVPARNQRAGSGFRMAAIDTAASSATHSLSASTNSAVDGFKANTKKRRKRQSIRASGACAPSQQMPDVPRRALNVLPMRDDESEALNTAVSSASAGGRLILVLAGQADASHLREFVSSADTARVADQILVVALDEQIVATAQALPVGAVLSPATLGPLLRELPSGSSLHRLPLKYLLASRLVALGVGLLVADVGTRFNHDPFPYVWGDSDLEVPGSHNGMMKVTGS